MSPIKYEQKTKRHTDAGSGGVIIIRACSTATIHAFHSTSIICTCLTAARATCNARKQLYIYYEFVH